MAIFILGPDPDGNCCGCENRTSPCDPCTPSECTCSLNIDSFQQSVALAQAFANNHVLDCFLYTTKELFRYSEYNLSVTDTIDVNAIEDPNNIVPRNGSISPRFSISLQTGNITINYNIIATGTSSLKICSFSVFLLTCSGSVISSYFTGAIVGSTLSGSHDVEIPDDLEYILSITLSTGDGGITDGTLGVTGDFSISCVGAMVLNPVNILYTEDGDPKELEVCPKLQIPISIFSPQAYGSEALAQAAIDSRTSNCIGFYPGNNNYITFTVTDNSSSVVIDATSQPQSFFGWPTISMWTSFIFQPSTSLTMAYNLTGTDPRLVSGRVMAVSISIYDISGNLIDTDSATSNWPTDQPSHNMIGSLILSVPNFGHYYVFCSAGGSGGGAPTPEELSGTMTLSTSTAYECLLIQARYESGTSCPYTLDCS